MADTDIGRLKATIEVESDQAQRKLETFKQKVIETDQAARQAGRGHQEFGVQLQNVEDRVLRTSSAVERHTGSLGSLDRALLRVTSGVFLFHTALQAGEAIVGTAVRGVQDLTKEAIAAEAAFAEVKKTTSSLTPSDAIALQGGLKRLTFEAPPDFQAVTGIASQGSQLGIPREDLESYTRTVEHVTAATTLSADATSKWLGQLQNLTHLDPSDFERIADSMTALSNFGSSTPQGIADISVRIAEMGRVIGLTQPQILGWAAAVSDAGLEAEAGGTSINKTFQQIYTAVMAGGGALRDVAGVANMTAESFDHLFRTDPNAALVAFIDGLKRTKDEGGDVISVMRALGVSDENVTRTLLGLALAQNEVASHTDISSKAFTEGGLAAERAAAQYETANAKLQILKNIISGEGATAASPLGESVKTLAAAAGEAVKADDALYEAMAKRLGPQFEKTTQILVPLVQDFMHVLPTALDITLQTVNNVASGIGTIVGWLQQAHETIEKIHNSALNFTPPSEPESTTVDGRTTPTRTVGMPSISPDVAASLAGRHPAQIAPPVQFGPEYTPQLQQIVQNTGIAESIARAQIASQVGAVGNSILTGADTARSSQSATDRDKVFADVQRLKDLMQKDLSPQEFARMGDTLTSLTTEYYARGGVAAKEALQEYLRTINETLSVEVPARKKAEAEAKQEAERLKREAETAARQAEREAARLAEQHAQLIANYNRGLVEGSAANMELGKPAASAVQALSNAMEREASGSQGTAAAQAVVELRNAAKAAGVPAWESLGADLAEGMGHALVAKTGEAKDAVLAKIKEISDAIASMSRLTVDNFQRVLGEAQQRTALGSEGSGLLSNLKHSAEDGTPEALQAVGDSVEAIRRKLIGDEGITPEQAHAWYAEVMAAVTRVIEKGGQDAQDALVATLGHLTLDEPIAALERAVELRLADAKRRMDQAKQDLEAQFDEQKQSASDSITDSRTLRGARENVGEEQARAYQNVADAADRARTNLRYFREDQALEVQQHRQIVDLQNQQADQMDVLRRKHLDALGVSSVGGQERMERARAEGLNVGPRQDPAYEAFRALRDADGAGQKAMRTLIERQAQERADRDDRRKNAEQDAEEEKRIAAGVTQFRQDQAKDLQRFEDNQVDDAWLRQWGPGGKSEQARDKKIEDMKAAYAELDADENKKLEERKARLTDLVSPVTTMFVRPLQDLDSMDDIIKSWPTTFAFSTPSAPTLPEMGGNNADQAMRAQGGYPPKPPSINQVILNAPYFGDLEGADNALSRNRQGKEDNYFYQGVV